MKKLSIAILVTALAVGLMVSATAGSAKSTATTADICVLLPDPKSSVRWETQDRPALVAAFKKAKVTYVINNADGDAQKQRSQADQCLANGAKVVILVSLDAGSSLAIERAAVAKQAKVIEYDRQVGKGSPASIYISFDGKAVGVLQGKGVVAGLRATGKYGQKPVVATLNGGETDNNSFLFKSGYDSILNPLFNSGHLREGPGPVRARTGTTRRRGRSSSRCSSGPGNKIDARRGGQRRPRQRGRDRPQGEEAEADPAVGPGCDGAGRAEHHLGLAVDDRVEGHADPRDALGRGGDRPGRTGRRRARPGS